MQNRFRSVLLFGPPGCGKGTQGKLLATGGSHLHLSSGDIFRGLDPTSEEGKLFASYADKGLLVPDEVTIAVWRAYMGNVIDRGTYRPESQLLLLDGLPRTEGQAKALAPHLDVVAAIVFDVTDSEVLVKRLQRRAAMEGRADDRDVAVLRKRLEVFATDTERVISKYSDVEIRVDALQPPLCVLRDILVGGADRLSVIK